MGVRDDDRRELLARSPGRHERRAEQRRDEAGRPGARSAPARPRQRTAPAGRTGWRRLVPTWRMVLGAFIAPARCWAAACSWPATCWSTSPPPTPPPPPRPTSTSTPTARQIARDGEVNRENVTLSPGPQDRPARRTGRRGPRLLPRIAPIDPKAMVRAGWNTATGKGKQSGSTITQQYVKNYYLGQEQTVTRKAKEFFIAIKLDREESKDDILEGYLNTSYFGRNAYGIQAAAQAYYGKDVADLDHRRGRLPRRPAQRPQRVRRRRPPREPAAAAVARWNYVLDGMVKKGWLSRVRARGHEVPRARHGQARHRPVRPARLPRRGRQGLPHQQQDHRRADASPPAATASPPPSSPSKQNAFVEAVDDQLMSKLDRRTARSTRYVRAGGASIDPKTGKVVAMYGGIDYTKQYVNNATRRDYQVGSTFKPFVFASAVQNDSTTQDGQRDHPEHDLRRHQQARGRQGRTAAPATPRRTRTTSLRPHHRPHGHGQVRQLGLRADGRGRRPRARSRRPPSTSACPRTPPTCTAYPSIALGTATASVLDMAEAYATLANHGRHGHVHASSRRSPRTARSSTSPTAEVEQAVSREAADTTTSVLRERGRGRHRHRRAGRRPPRRGQDRHRRGGQGRLVRRLHPRTGHRRRRHGPGLRDRRRRSRCTAPPGWSAINGGGCPAEIWARLHRRPRSRASPYATSTSTRTAAPTSPAARPPHPGPPSRPPTPARSPRPPAPPLRPATPRLRAPRPASLRRARAHRRRAARPGDETGGEIGGEIGGEDGGWQGGNTSGEPATARTALRDEEYETVDDG